MARDGSVLFPGAGTLVEELVLEGKAKGKAEGKAEALVEAVLRTLRHRGIEVPEDVRERITGCRDLAALEDWADRAFTVAAAQELLGEAG